MKTLASKSGAILGYTIGIIAFLTMLVTSLWTLTLNSHISTQQNKSDIDVFQSAENALNYAYVILDETIKTSTFDVFEAKLSIVEAAFGLDESVVSDDKSSIVIKKTDEANGKTYKKTLTIESDGGKEVNDILFGNDETHLLSDWYNYQNLLLQYLYDYSNDICENTVCDIGKNQLFPENNMFTYIDEDTTTNVFTDMIDYIWNNKSSITTSIGSTAIGPASRISNTYWLNDIQKPYYENVGDDEKYGDMLTYLSGLSAGQRILLDDITNSGHGTSGVVMGSKFSSSYSLVDYPAAVNGELGNMLGKTLSEYFSYFSDIVKAEFREEYLESKGLKDAWLNKYNEIRAYYGYNPETGLYSRENANFAAQYDELKNTKRSKIYELNYEYAKENPNSIMTYTIGWFGLSITYDTALYAKDPPYNEIYRNAFNAARIPGFLNPVKNSEDAHEAGRIAYANAKANDEIAAIEQSIRNEFYIGAESVCETAAINEANTITGLDTYFSEDTTYDIPVLDDRGNYTFNEDGEIITKEVTTTINERVSYLANIDAQNQFEEDTYYATENNIIVESYTPYYINNAGSWSETTFKDVIEDKTIVIKSGTSLFVDGDLVLGRNAHVIVEYGAMLFINGDLSFKSLYNEDDDESVIPSFTSEATGETSVGPTFVAGDLIYDVRYYGALASNGALGLAPSTFYTKVIGGQNGAGDIGTHHALEGTFIVNGDVFFEQNGGARPSDLGSIFGLTLLKSYTPVGNIRPILRATFYVNGSFRIEPKEGSDYQTFGIGFATDRPTFIFANSISVVGSYKIANLIDPIIGYAFQISEYANFGGMVSMFVNMFSTEEETADELASLDNQKAWYSRTIVERIDKTDLDYSGEGAETWGLPNVLRDGLIVGLISSPVTIEN